MESCAQTWGALGPLGGGRRVPLLHGLEQRLNRIESLTRCAEQSYAGATAPSAIHRAAQEARRALMLLGSESARRAEALSSLEAASLSLAAAAAQGAINIESFGIAKPRRGEAASERGKELERIAVEVSRSAHGLQRGAGDCDAGIWFARCLSLRPPHAAMHLCRQPTADRNLRAESLLAVRASWLRLGARELLFLKRLDHQGHKRRAPRDPGAQEAVSLYAGKLLSQCYLDERPQMFGHEAAWHQQSLHLARVVATVWSELERGDGQQRFDLVRRRVLGRLSRALVAIWAIDAETGYTAPAKEGSRA